MYCSTRNESHIDGMTQEKCQAACIQDSKCVGIAYSYKEGKTHRCYTCTEDNLTDAPDNFGFYRRPGSALGYRFQLCIFNPCKHTHLQYSKSILFAGCKCKDFVSENGHGNCLTNSKHSQHNGDKMCYVEMPSRCQDLVASSANPENFFSEEACKKKGSSFHLTLKIVEITVQSTWNLS